MGAGASIGGYQDTIDECVSVLKDKDQIKDLWSEIDFNGNGYVSLAEIDKVGMFRECVGCWHVSLYSEIFIFCKLTSCVMSTDGSITRRYWKGSIQEFQQ